MTNSRKEMSVSTLRKVRKLRQTFVDTFAERVEKLEAWQVAASMQRPERETVRALRTEIHQLRGSAGLYQMDELYNHLNSLQDLLDRQLEDNPLQALGSGARQHLERIIKLLQFPARFL